MRNWLEQNKGLTKFAFGSNSELITLDAPCSGDERKAELICCLIYGVFSSQFGHNRNIKSVANLGLQLRKPNNSINALYRHPHRSLAEVARLRMPDY